MPNICLQDIFKMRIIKHSNKRLKEISKRIIFKKSSNGNKAKPEIEKNLHTNPLTKHLLVFWGKVI